MASGVSPQQTAPRTEAGSALTCDQYIEGQLRKTSSGVKLVDFSFSLLVLVVAVLAYFALMAVIDHWIVPGGLGFWGRGLFFAVLLSGAGYFIIRRMVPVLLGRINPVYAAYTIERSAPALKNSLLNFLLFRNRQRGEVPEVIYQAMEQQAATRLSKVPVELAVDRGKILKIGYVLAALAVVCALYKVFSPKDPLVTVQRILLPWADILPPSRVQIEEVKPGAGAAVRGEQIAVSARIRGIREREEVNLFYSTDDGQIVDREIPLHLASNGLDFTCNLPESEAGLQEGLTYWLTAGDATSHRFHLDVLTAPTIALKSVYLKYPAYSKLIDRNYVRDGNLRAIEGTKVTLRAETNAEIKTAWVDFGNDKKLDLEMQHQGLTAWVTFPLEWNAEARAGKHSLYSLRYTTVDGRSNQDPVEYRIEVVPDIAPEIVFLQPEPSHRDTEVPLNGTLTIETRAIDPDYALAKVELRGRVGEKEIPLKSLLEKEQTGQFVGRHDLIPSAAKLKPGDVVEYWAVATDNKQPKPNLAETEHYRFKVTSPQKPEQEQIARNDQPMPDQQDPNQKPPPEDQQENKQDPGQGTKPNQPNNKQPQPGEQPEQGDNQQQQPGEQKQPGQENQPGQKNQPGENQQPMPKEGDEKKQPQKQEGEKQQGEQQEGQKGGEGQAGGEGEPGGESQSGGEGQQGSKGRAGKPGESSGGETGEEQEDGAAGQPKSGESRGGNRSGESQPDEVAKEDEGTAIDRLRELAEKWNKEEKKSDSGQKQPAGQQPGEKQPGEKQPGEKQPGEQDPAQQQPGERKSGGQPGEKQPANSDQKNPGGAEQGTEQPQQRGTGEKPDPNNKQQGRPGGAQEPMPDPGQSGKQPGEKPTAGEQKQPGEKPGAGEKPAPGERPAVGEKPQPGEKPGPGEKQTPGEKPTPREKPTGSQQVGENEKQPGEKQPGEKQPAAGQVGEEDPAGAQPMGGEPGEKPGTEKKENPAGKQPTGAEGEGNKAKPGEEEKTAEKKQPGGQEEGQEPTGGEGEKTKGNAGAGSKEAKDKTGSPDAQNNIAPKNDKKKEPGEKPGESDDPKSPAHGKKESDSDGSDGGHSAGGGKPGGGQKAPLPGTGSPGGNTASDEGQGNAEDTGGTGDKSAKGGDDAEADKPPETPGEKKAGDGRKKLPGEQAEGKRKPGPGDQPGESQTAEGESSTETERPSDQAGSSGEPTGGEQGDGVRQPRTNIGEAPAAEDPNLEYSRKATDLVLDYLENQMSKDDLSREVQEQLPNWSKEDVQALVDRARTRMEAAKGKGPESAKAKEELNDWLRSLGLKKNSSRGVTQETRQTNDAVGGLRQSSGSKPPAEYADQVEAYKKGLSRQRSTTDK